MIQSPSTVPSQVGQWLKDDEMESKVLERKWKLLFKVSVACWLCTYMKTH